MQRPVHTLAIRSTGRLSLAATLAAALFAPLTAEAAGPFAPPEGCRLELTVQMRGCSVSQHYRCAADTPGDQWAAYLGAGGGAVHVSRIDAETRWMESVDPETGIRDRLDPEAADHASLDTLLATGRDDFDFWTEADDGFRMHHVGFDVLTGERTVIDGVTLEVTRFELTTTGADGEVLWQRQGQQFVSRTQRRFYGGVETARDWTGAREDTNDTPVDFVFPGEAGFGSVDPRHDCDLLTSAAGRAAG